VLVVDDHPVVRTGVRSLLADAADVEVVGEACDGRQAIAAAERHNPDVVLMDLRMPDLGGVEATRRILEARPGTAVVILTGPNAEDDVVAALEAGALGYLAKSAPRSDFLAALRTVRRGEAWLPAALTRRILGRLRPAASEPAVEALTPRELEVFELLASGLANGEIADRLGIAEITVRTHVSHLFAKLGVSNRVQAALHAWRRGLVPPQATEPEAGKGAG